MQIRFLLKFFSLKSKLKLVSYSKVVFRFEKNILKMETFNVKYLTLSL